MKLEFFGAAKSVTGSCHCITHEGTKLLIDCGMRQGADAKGAYGENNFPFEPHEIDAVAITHAHIDHSGLLPLLVKRGFKGRVYCTEATGKLLQIMLPDSAHIQMQDAQWQSRKNARAGKPEVEPLYDMDDVTATLKLIEGIAYGKTINAAQSIRLRMLDAGHLLGSAAVEVYLNKDGKDVKLVFSGDLGRTNRPITCDPARIEDADFLILEGTYGNKNHKVETEKQKEDEILAAIKTAMSRGGNLVIPSFAVGRTQDILYYIKRILQSGVYPELAEIPVYIDSPLGIEATNIYENCARGYFDENALDMLKSGPLFDFPTLRVAQSADESKLINELSGKKIIISSSGMCEAGRIRHHLKHNLYRAESTILFAGYQAQGTLGRTLIDGVKKVKLFGEEVRVNAQIAQIKGFSGHAGKDELIAWARAIKEKPKKVFLVHGEPQSLYSLRDNLLAYDYDVYVPDLGECVELDMTARTKPATPKVKDFAIPAEQLTTTLEKLTAMHKSMHSGNVQNSALKLTMFTADLASLVEKWEGIIDK